jgi:hypothetical protein
VKLSPRAVGLLVVVSALAGASACAKLVPTPPAKSSSTAAGEAMLAVARRPALPAGWQEFQHPEQVFSVYVPGPPVRPRNSHPSLKFNQPLAPLEARESIHKVSPTDTQPLVCSLQITLFHPSGRSAYHAYDSRPWVVPRHWVITADRDVVWGGRPAREIVVEQTFPQAEGQKPLKYFSAMRFCIGPDYLYEFSIGRQDRLPEPAELAAFFDSFVPGK